MSDNEDDYGYLYCLENEGFGSRRKVGYTTKNVKDRMNELFSATGVAYPFTCVLAKRVQNPSSAEKFVHHLLNEYRVYKNKEFFDADIEIIKKAMDQVHGNYIDVEEFNSIKNDKTQNSKEESIQLLTCQRCGYETSRKYDLKKHLNRTVPCKAILQDIEREELLAELNKIKIREYLCDICNKAFKTPQSKYIHKRSCIMKNHHKESNYINLRLFKLENKIKEISERIDTAKVFTD